MARTLARMQRELAASAEDYRDFLESVGVRGSVAVTWENEQYVLRVRASTGRRVAVSARDERSMVRVIDDAYPSLTRRPGGRVTLTLSFVDREIYPPVAAPLADPPNDSDYDDNDVFDCRFLGLSHVDGDRASTVRVHLRATCDDDVDDRARAASRWRSARAVRHPFAD